MVATATLITRALIVKLTYKQVHEAAKMESDGVEVWALSQIFDVHDMTMRKYLRAYYKYGKSFWSRYPTEVEHGGSSA